MVPGRVYSIVIGSGGAGGVGGTNLSINGLSGNSGGSSTFDGVLIANGGSAGAGGSAGFNTCSIGANGTNGLVTNYGYVTPASRGYIPAGYFSSPGSSAGGGHFGLYSTGVSTPVNGQSGAVGEDGFCIITY